MSISKNYDTIKKEVFESKDFIKESAILEVDLPNEIISMVDAGNLPKFIVVGDGPEATTYKYSGSSSPNLYEIMCAQKGRVGKIIYMQDSNESNPKMPQEIHLEIVKTMQSKRTALTIGNVNTK